MAIKTYKKDGSVMLSPNFTTREFACHGSGCCDAVMVDEGLVGYLQQIRDHVDAPVHINSGYRCPIHNAAVGGAAGSYHTKGMAADIRVEGLAPLSVAQYAQRIGILGIGLYADFVHIDTRTQKSFWYGHGEAYRETFLPGYSLNLPYLSRGDSGEQVRALQQLLIVKGYPCGQAGADGAFGLATDGAVRRFQKQQGLNPDGIVGAATMARLLGGA